MLLRPRCADGPQIAGFTFWGLRAAGAGAEYRLRICEWSYGPCSFFFLFVFSLTSHFHQLFFCSLSSCPLLLVKKIIYQSRTTMTTCPWTQFHLALPVSTPLLAPRLLQPLLPLFLNPLGSLSLQLPYSRTMSFKSMRSS